MSAHAGSDPRARPRPRPAAIPARLRRAAEAVAVAARQRTATAAAGRGDSARGRRFTREGRAASPRAGRRSNANRPASKSPPAALNAWRTSWISRFAWGALGANDQDTVSGSSRARIPPGATSPARAEICSSKRPTGASWNLACTTSKDSAGRRLSNRSSCTSSTLDSDSALTKPRAASRRSSEMSVPTQTPWGPTQSLSSRSHPRQPQPTSTTRLPSPSPRTSSNRPPAGSQTRDCSWSRSSSLCCPAIRYATGDIIGRRARR